MMLSSYKRGSTEMPSEWLGVLSCSRGAASREATVDGLLSGHALKEDVPCELSLEGGRGF